MFHRYALNWVLGFLSIARLFLLLLMVGLLLAGPISLLHAAITPLGNVEPVNPATWTSSTTAYIGHTASGTLTVNDNSDLLTYAAYIGYNNGVTGTATVDGIGSTWTGYDLFVGVNGVGNATISNGGTASLSHYCLVGSTGASTSVMNVTGADASLYAYHLSVGANPFGAAAGAVNITNGGSVYTSDYGGVDGLWVGYGTGSLTVDGIGSKLVNRGGGFSITSSTSAILKIRNGATVSTQGNGAFIAGDPWGYPSSPKGYVSVDGVGSALSIDGEEFHVGYYGSGTLMVTRGASVTSSYDVYVATYSGSSGVVQIDGAGSSWNNSGNIFVGFGGNATVSITGGATVNVGSILVNNLSVLAVDVGRGSTFAVGGGWGGITNNGKVRVLAGANVPTGNIYSPFMVGYLTGSGTIQPVGGTWNSASLEFTVSDVQSTTSGVPVPIDLSLIQRIRVTDSTSGRVLGTSFLAKTTTSSLTFGATAISDGPLTALNSLAGSGNTVLGGWMLSASGAYTSGDPAYLSYSVGFGHSIDDLQIWKYSSGSWSKFAATDLTYDDAFASFTVTGMGTYAVTGLAVPEPSTIALLLGAAVGGLLVWRRRR